MKYPIEILSLPHTFSFPKEALALILQGIGKENPCSWCNGKGYRVKDNVKTFCRPCDGLGTSGGYGRHQPSLSQPPSSVFQVSERTLEMFA